jgi:hypothetical protein
LWQVFWMSMNPQPTLPATPPGADEQQQLADLSRLCAQARSALPAEATPCFAHLRIEAHESSESGARSGAAARGRTRDLLLGFRTVSTPQLTVVNWQTAPLAEVFFTTRVGEEYELEVGDKLLSGTVRARSLLQFQAGELAEVQTATGTFRRADAAGWLRTAPPAPLLAPRRPGSGRAAPPWSREALDSEQRRAVDLSPGQPLLVLGEAGCGKTTVALHRVAALAAAARLGGRPFSALVVLPAASAGLAHLSETLLARLGAPEVEVSVFDRWAGRQARKAFAGLPERESVEAPAGAVAIKRHPALLDVLAKLVRRRNNPTLRQAGANRADLLHLFGDQRLLEQVAAAAGGAISHDAVQKVLAHTKVQFSRSTEESSKHIDADRLVTVDGSRIDEGTPMEDAGSIDSEDHAVLFALSALRAGIGADGRPGGPGPTQYDCVVIDEAQEFAPIELQLIGRAVRPGGTLVVAGDEAQQVDPTAYFASFTGVMQALGAPAHTTVRLEVSYRCPPAVTALARTLRGDAAATAAPAADSGDAAVVRARFASECHLVTRLIDSLQELRAADPAATIAVICRSAAAAQRLAGLLERGVDARLVRDGDFRFAAPIEVTCVAEVRGLEFDYVIVPDAASATYDEGGPARRALYVAVTRTSQQLLLASTGTWTPLLAEPSP